MRVISKTVDWESSNLISGRNSAGGFLSGIGEEDNPDSNRKQRDFLRSLWVHVLEEGLGKFFFLFPN